MDELNLKSILDYVSQDFDRVISFWLKNSHDHVFGGFFNCIDENGRVYDETKYIWLQARFIDYKLH